MTTSDLPEGTGLTRRGALKLAGMAVGGLAVAGSILSVSADPAQSADQCPDCPPATCPADKPGCGWTDTAAANRYSYFDTLPEYHPFRPRVQQTDSTIPLLGKDQIRITFMGSCIPNNLRKAQQMMSIFVEVGWDDAKQAPLDNFIFDCGPGVCTNYNSMNVNFGRMNKVFINHLHGDHMSDLTQIYCFGPSSDRLSPLYVWGPGPSGVVDPSDPEKKHTYDDGVQAYCEHLREMCRWHTESFSFQNTSYSPPPPTGEELQKKWGLPCVPKPVGKYAAADADSDGYALVPIQLDWENGGVAYDNKDTGVKITYFKVIHARRGSVGYKLEFTPPNVPGAKPLSMIYSSDTKPETLCVENAINEHKGVDVLIHEMIVPAEIWAMKMGHLTDPSVLKPAAVQRMQTVQNSSHSPQGAFGHLLSRIKPYPRLTVATHFPVADDTVACAWKSVSEHVNIVRGNDTKSTGNEARITWSFDLMVLTVDKRHIVEQKGAVSDFEFSATAQPVPGTPNTPKYNDGKGGQDPYAQIDQSTAIQPCECDGTCNYRPDGY